MWADATGDEIEGLEYYNGELFVSLLNEGIIQLDVYNSSIRYNNNTNLANGDGFTLVSDDPSFPETGTIIIKMNSWDGGGISPQQIFSADTTIDASRKWGLQVQDPEAAAYRVYPTGFHYEANITGTVAIDHTYVCTWEKDGATVDTTFYIDGTAIDGTINSTWVAPDSGGIILANRSAEEGNYRFGATRIIFFEGIVLSQAQITSYINDPDAILNVYTLTATAPTGTKDRIGSNDQNLVDPLDCGEETDRSVCTASGLKNRIVKITAYGGPDRHFVSWSGDVSGTTNPLYVKMDSDYAIGATFAAD